MGYESIIYEPGTVARVIMNRPRYHNAQSRMMLEEMDDAFAKAAADDKVRVIIMSGNGEHFSSGHDIGTPEQQADHAARGGWPAKREPYYNWMKDYYLDMSLRWRSLPKPTIAMVHGYCIYGGWIVASSMDLIFASEDAQFLGTHTQFFPVPWDVGIRRAKDVLFEGRFITAQEALDWGFVSRVWPREKLEEETLAYAQRVAENHPFNLRMCKFSVNHAQDLMGFTSAVQAALQTFFTMQYGRHREGVPKGTSLIGNALKHSGETPE